MRTPTTDRNLRESDIDTAIRNASLMWEQGYTVSASETVPGTFFCIKPNGERYVVATDAGWESCNCPQFEKAGVCKHQVFVQDWNRIEAGEDAAEYGRHGL